MKALRLAALTLLAIFAMGATECQHTNTVVVPEGPMATALGKTKDEQIAGLAAQVKAEMAARELAEKASSLAAANFETILFAAGYVDAGLPRNAIEEEAKLGIARSSMPDPAEIIKGKDRVIAILQNDVAKAKAAYGQAFDEAAQAKAAMKTLDADIAARDKTIAARDTQLIKLAADAKVERDQHVDDMKKALAAKDTEIQRVKDEAASKERATWVLWTRIAGLAFIVIGAVIAIVFKVIPEGASFVGVGVLIGLVSIFIDWLTGQWWFGWMCGGIILIILVAGGYALYRMWKRGVLHDKTTAALQDLKDEATTLGTDAWNKVAEHLTYRLGDKDSFWAKAQTNAVAALGLVNPKAEAAASSQDDSLSK